MFEKTAFVVMVTALAAGLQAAPAIGSETSAAATSSVPIASDSINSTVAPDAAASPQSTKPLEGRVHETRVEVNAAVREIKSVNDKLARDSLLMANEANRHVTPPPMAPNVAGGTVLPTIPLDNVSLGPLPPRPRVLRAVLGDINSEVRALQHDEREINETVCGLGNEQATMWWNRIVSTTSDIIQTYRALEPAALSPRPQVRLLAMPTIHLYEDTKTLNSLWKHFNAALGAGSDK